MKWITREKARVDRIACPWLIKRFVDPQAEFIFVPKDRVLKEAEETGAIPFDVPGAELFHYREGNSEFVSFDSVIKKYHLNDSALLELARIVRGADASIPDTLPESAGLEAAATGFHLISHDDFDNMRLQFPLYDALYEYCRSKVNEGKVLKHSV
ncbi:MAG: chromate resistance protein [Candidatus Thermoplasmatota archaeon]|nr:chromate resistance protein [Candidatus Thermoplasmatota archaeon]MCL6003164.1 chromate resistance protein [Candidatus Thermoplasmatota archaeon]